jgi:hypothetical protein
MINFWLIKKTEKNILKVIEWAHREKIPLCNLSKEDIVYAMKTYLRDSLHS